MCRAKVTGNIAGRWSAICGIAFGVDKPRNHLRVGRGDRTSLPDVKHVLHSYRSAGLALT